MSVDKPTIRALTIFATVATEGPATLNQLCELHPEISRMAIWRGLNNLRDAGWARMRLGDNAWVITHLADDILGAARIPPRAAEELAADLPKPAKGQRIRIGAFTDLGRFEVIESTDAEEIGAALSLIGDPLAFTALAITEEANMLRHLSRWIEADATEEERALVTSAALKNGLRAARQRAPSGVDGGEMRRLRAGDGSVAAVWIG